ncbi:hypothetical protein ERO13_D11G026200v2 [Gossypium hirsutum]|uniref:Uncharacterized protein isoform X2 n=1 Tax=Gossypium hirsutum TaxID=3635 RepID=A0A1U8JZS7_GOSHI|nr:uncharacterized protein LOC107912213 isoform X2 [Gossypium hirsutum]XP_040961389.1 uncharacterized protein LOC107912213 isoform X2 [Gossypium hirsutum]XP_040961391.1 uncharacterized protein LOC107912213 isoform X2 [Gossypium hirsutum]XP_040961392.1 uncharacterized protein LOC107912213 isoform X2 [Gossypium hirsutum]KAG4118603.1 hypothetical protein ERO13_D11G026200v2 [Gossypium hirsutum]
MDYDDNDFQSPNLHLAGEGNNKFPPVLRPYALSKFDFDDNLHGRLRFDSLVETEAFLGIESGEDNQWIEDFSRGSSGIAFSSSAAEPCSISRHNNVWSEAASSESVEMLLKSVGQDESVIGQSISKDSDACDELGGIIRKMEPSLEHGDSGLSKVGLQPALQTGEIPGKLSGLEGDVLGDHGDVSQTHKFDPSVDGALKAPNIRNTDLSEREESKDGEEIVVNENQVEVSVDQFVDNREQVDNFASGSQTDIVIPSVKNTCASSKDSDASDEQGGIIKQMEPTLKHGDCGLSEVDGSLQPALQTGEIPGKFSGLKGDVSGDHLLVEDVSQSHEFEPSIDRALEVPNMRNTDLPERDESKDGEQIVANQNQVEASVDQLVDNREQADKFASGSQVDTVIPSVQNTRSSSAFLESQDKIPFKNDVIDETVVSLARENVDSSQEVHIDGENLIGNAGASVTLHVQKHSALDIQSKEEGHAIGNIIPTVGKPSDRILKENSDLHMVEGCSKALGVESPPRTGISKDIVLSVGKLHNISPMPFVGDTNVKEKESETSNTDAQISVSRESKLDNLDSMVQVACDAIEKDLSEIHCHSDSKILSSKPEKYLLSVQDVKGSKGEGDGAHNTLGAEPTRIDEEFTVSEHNDDYKFDQSVSAAAKQNTQLPSDCSKTDHGEGGSPVVIKGVDSSSFGTGDNVAISGKSVDCVLLPYGKSLPSAAVFDQKEVQVSSPEASLSIMKSTEMKTVKGAPCEAGEQSSCKKVDQSLSSEDTSNAVGQSGDQTVHGVSLEAVKNMHAPSNVSDSIVRETDGAEAEVVSKRGSSVSSGAVSIQDNNKTLTNSEPSTSKELSHNADQNHPEDGDHKLPSEQISGQIVVHHADGDHVKTHNSSFPSAPSSESQTKIHIMECGSSSADLDNPSCGSPILVRISEQPESEIGTPTVKGSKDLGASVSGVTNGEGNKEMSISQDTKGHVASSGDGSFTFEVSPLASLSEKEAGKNWQPFSTVQHDKTSSVVERIPSTSKRENLGGGSKGSSERKTRRAGSKSTGKEAAKKGVVAKDTTPARQSERSGRTSNVSLSTSEIGQLVKSNEMQYLGHMEVFNQPFTDLQQVQLRSQIFVYGALIQGIAPDEAYMISAFGGPDGGRTIWEKAWQACMDRVHCKKSLVSPETPLQTHIGAKTPDQSIKQNALQTKTTSSPASLSNNRGTSTTIVKPMIPLSSPLWTIPTPSSDALQPASIPRGAVADYQQALSPLHTPPIRNFVGHNAPWMSQSPFRGPWVPQSSAFDNNTHFPVLPITEAVNLTPVREASVPNSSIMKQVSTVPMVQSGSPANVLAGTPLLDNKNATFRTGQHSADPKPRKRKMSTVSEDHGQIILHSQTETLLDTVVNSHASTPAAITTPAAIVSKLATDKFITSVSTDYLEKGDRDSDPKATLSEETLGKLKEAQKQAEVAAALAAAAVSHSQEIWNQLDKQKNTGLAPDVETKLTSAAVAIAAAAAVAKAAAAAANVASNAALQAKMMADEVLVPSGCRDPIPINALSSDSVKKLGKATTASILRGEDASTSSNSVIVAAKEASKRRVEAASAASKQAENMDAVVKAAELAAEAVSQAGKIVMGEPFPLTELVEAGPEAYWKVSHASPEPNAAIREHLDKGGNVEAPGSVVGHSEEVPTDKNENQSNNHEISLILREMARDSVQDHSRLTDGILGSAATSGNDKKGQKGRKASDIAKSKGVSTNTEHGKAKETSKDNNVKEGSHVEVLRDGDGGGLKVAWFPADILELKDGKAYVCYNELRSEDGDRLKEWVEVEGEGDRAPRIRSSRPITAMPFEGTRKRCRAAMGDYNWSTGDRVDAWIQDSWWEGVVNEKSKKDETSFTIHFPAQGETSVVKAWLLRPSLMWKDGNWVEWSSCGDNDGSSHEGDTPLEKRPRICSPVIENKEDSTKCFDSKESEKPDNTRLLDLTAGEKIFNIGKSTRDESKPGSLRMKRSGLKKEGSRVIFGVPKPGKKRKFMEVSKHYVADRSSRTLGTSDSAKFTKHSMPRGSEPGTKNKTEPKEKRNVISKPKVLKSGKPPSVSSRTIPQKDSLSSIVGSEPDDAVTADVSKFKDSASGAENISGEHNLELRSSSSDGAAEGQVLFSCAALPSDAPPEKASTSNAKSESISKGKLAPVSGKLAKVEEEMKIVSEAVEPRRSNRKIQPTSRLLEGIQSSLIISKVPVSHDKGQKGQSRSTRGSNQG